MLYVLILILYFTFPLFNQETFCFCFCGGAESKKCNSPDNRKLEIGNCFACFYLLFFSCFSRLECRCKHVWF